VWGNAVLHHLNLRKVASELRRVLAPGGVAVFCEPWGENPLLAWARWSLPYPGKGRTAHEQPLRRRDLVPLRQAFPNLECRGFQFLAMARRVLKPGRLMSALQCCDSLLLQGMPLLRGLCRYVVLTLRRDS
jgi:hypothetical protein